MQFAFRNDFDMRKDLYKYKIAISIEKIKLNINPCTMKDIKQF